MSKRSERREELARKLDAGQITQRNYDEQMARLGARGKASQAAHQARLQARKVKEWSPQSPEVVRRGPKLHGTGKKVPLGLAIDPEVDAMLRVKAAQAGMSLAQLVERAIRQVDA